MANPLVPAGSDLWVSRPLGQFEPWAREKARQLRLPGPFPSTRLSIQDPGLGTRVHNGVRAFAGGADLQQEIGPQARLFVERVADELAGAVVGDREERPDKVTVVAENGGVEVKNAHK